MTGGGSETKQACRGRSSERVIGVSPFCTLSHRRKISSPPLTLPLFLLTRQILSSAVFGAPDVQKQTVNNRRVGGAP